MHEAASGGRSELSHTQREPFLDRCGNCPSSVDNNSRDNTFFGFLDDVFVYFSGDTVRLFVYGLLAPVD